MSVLLALLSSVLWGSADFGGGLASRRLPAIAVVGWTQAAALLGLAALAVATSAWSGPTGWIGWSVTAGAVGALALIAFYLALATGTMGVVSPIAALGALVPVLAGILSGHLPSRVQAAGMVLALIGAVGASGPELSGRASRRSVSLAALAALAGLGFGIALLGIARGSQLNATMTMLGMRATSVAGFALAALVTRSLGGVRPRDLPLLVAVGLADGGANLTYGLASRGQLLAIVAVLGALYPVSTVLLARYVLHERMMPMQRVAVAAALVGVVLLAAG
jgi:drug/metabolite transporter (DMT)-like permease